MPDAGKQVGRDYFLFLVVLGSRLKFLVLLLKNKPDYGVLSKVNGKIKQF